MVMMQGGVMLKIDKSKISKVLVISLSNFGDIIMTFPVIDIIRRDFGQADLSIMVGPKGKQLLIDNPKIDHLYIYDKKMSFKQKWKWLSQLRKEKFDFIVDLRHSIFPLLLMPRYRTKMFRRRIATEHYRDQHLRCLYDVYPAAISKELYCFCPSSEDENFITATLRQQLQPEDQIAVLAPGAADHRKRWSEQGFAEVADYLTREHSLNIVFIGDENDAAIVSRIMARMHRSAIDLSGKITFSQSGLLIKRAAIAIVNDSSPMHMASYLGTPVVSLFGPTDPVKCGPWGDWSGFIRHNDNCMSCQEKIPDAEHTCLDAITFDEVVVMAERLLNPRF